MRSEALNFWALGANFGLYGPILASATQFSKQFWGGGVLGWGGFGWGGLGGGAVWVGGGLGGGGFVLLGGGGGGVGAQGTRSNLGPLVGGSSFGPHLWASRVA